MTSSIQSRLASLVRIWRLARTHGARGLGAALARRVNRVVFDAADRVFDAHHGIESTREVHADALTIDSPHTDWGEDPVIYVGTPILALRRSFRHLPADPRAWTFVDYGSGKGRVLVAAGRRPFARVVGVEFARQLHEQAERNIRKASPHLSARLVESVLADAVEYGPPPGPWVCFFFNPFEPPVMEKVTDRIDRSLVGNPRPTIVIAHGNVSDEHIQRLPDIRLIARRPGVPGVGPMAGFRVYANGQALARDRAAARSRPISAPRAPWSR